MEITSERADDGAAVVRLRGRLTVDRVGDLKQSLTTLLGRRTGRVDLDLGELTAIDSAGLQLLLATMTQARSVDSDFRVMRAVDAVHALMKLYGLAPGFFDGRESRA